MDIAMAYTFQQCNKNILKQSKKNHKSIGMGFEIQMLHVVLKENRCR